MSKIEFVERDDEEKGKFVAVLLNSAPVGRIARNGLGEWCYFSGMNELSAEVVSSNLDAVKSAVAAMLG